MNEIQELQEFRAELDEPAPSALTRARARALHGSPARRNGWIWLRRLAVPAVAAVVVAIVVSVTMIANRGTAPQPGPPVPSLPPTTAEAIEWLARRAEAGPAAAKVDTEHLIQVRSRFLREGKWSERTFRIDPYGLFEVSDEEKWDKARFREFLAQRRESLAFSPGMGYPTPEWFATLEVNPQTLRPEFHDRRSCPANGCVTADLQRYMWMFITLVARVADVMVPPHVRAALLRELGAIPGVTVHQVTIDGRTYWALRDFSLSVNPAELYVDPVSGRISGEGQASSTDQPANVSLFQSEVISL
jgi:hypothetical protein